MLKRQITLNRLPKDVTEKEIIVLPVCDACQRAEFTKRRLKRFEKNNIGRGERMRVKGLGAECFYQEFLDAFPPLLCPIIASSCTLGGHLKEPWSSLYKNSLKNTTMTVRRNYLLSILFDPLNSWREGVILGTLYLTGQRSDREKSLHHFCARMRVSTSF